MKNDEELLSEPGDIENDHSEEEKYDKALHLDHPNGVL
jgi:hypothetical protein